MATPGPWDWVWHGDWAKLETPGGLTILDDGSACGEYNQEIDPYGFDAHFIAHARQDIPALLAALERTQAQNAALVAVLEAATKVIMPVERLQPYLSSYFVDQDAVHELAAAIEQARAAMQVQDGA